MMKTIKVKEERLKELTQWMVDGFNDCACCPLSDGCPRRDDDLGIDSIDCAEEIIANYLQ